MIVYLEDYITYHKNKKTNYTKTNYIIINIENDRKISNTYGEKIFHLCQASGSGNGEVITKQYTTGHDAGERNGKRVP